MQQTSNSGRCYLTLGFTVSIIATIALSVVGPVSAVWSGERETVVSRVGGDIKYLASDELEGRGPGTAGLDKAAQYIRACFENLGVPGAAIDGAYERPFSIQLGSHSVPSQTFLNFVGPDGKTMELKIRDQYQPLASGVSKPLELDLVFAGYGITASSIGYDDYEGLNLTGKAVLIIRREPQQDDDSSKFDGKRASRHSYIRSKLRAAEKAGAEAIILVNDPFTVESDKEDKLSRPGGFGRKQIEAPFVHVSQEFVDGLLATTPVAKGEQQLDSLAKIEEAIDVDLKPLSQPMDGWKVTLQCVFESSDAQVTNVAAVIDGEGEHAEETIVIGAHYDHLGLGPYGSRRPGSNAVHNGADDNATGTAAVLELARRFASRGQKPSRRLVFVAFTGEERGLLGSNYYVENPLYPLDNTIAMLNFDMIGHLDDNGLTVGGTGSSPELATIVQDLSEGSPYEILTPSTTGGSDHAKFYRKEIPFLFFHTGMTDIYHTPDDDYETLDIQGAVASIDFAERVIDGLLSLEERPKYTKIQRAQRASRATAYLGIVPEYNSESSAGITIAQVNDDSPAAQGSLKQGDVITKIGDVEIKSMRELSGALRKYSAGDKVKVCVSRGKEELILDVKLGTPGGAP